MSHFTTVFNRS